MRLQAQRTRDRNILDMVRDLLVAEAAFQGIERSYRQGSLHFSEIEGWVDDRGQSLLFRLKEKCHALFRNHGKWSSHKNEWLLDLAVGSIFHEAIKLRENIYQLEFYRPKYLEFQSKAGKLLHEKDLLRQFERIISKAEEGVREGMEETRSLFQDAIAQLIDFFKGNSKNPFLVRFLLEDQPLLAKVYGAKQGRNILKIMFPQGLFEAYDLVGRSYLRSEHYDLSSRYLAKALKLAPQHPDLQFLHHFSQAMNAYYKSAYSKALSGLRKLVPVTAGLKSKREYLRKAEEICHRMSSELRDDQRPVVTQKCRLLADEIRRMLQ